MVLGLKGRPQSGKLIDDAAEGPDVGLLIVALVVDLLGAHVIGRADVGVGEHTIVVHHAGETEVADFDVVVGVKENVTGLEIAVDDFLGLLRYLARFVLSAVDRIQI